VSGARGRQALVALLAAIYSVCFVAIKAGLPFAPPLLFGSLRALIGGLGLLGILAVLRQPLLPARNSWGWVLGLALSTTMLGFAGMFLSPGQTGAGIASVLGNLQPILVIALAGPLLGEPVTRVKAAALGLGAAGVLLISSAALLGTDAYGLSGALLALAASGGAAIGSVLAKRMGAQPHLLAIAAWQLLLGSLPLFGASAFFEQGREVAWTGTFVGILLFLALAGTALPTPLWYWLLQHDDVGRLTIGLFLVPVFGLAIAAVVFGERVNLLEGLGLALAVAGAGVAALGDGRRHELGATAVSPAAPLPVTSHH